jgi:hypothetical protein
MKRQNIFGRYKPKNQYKFDGKDAIYRSLWERKVMLYLDQSDAVVRWSSESLAIPYMHEGKQRTYYPDFVVEYIDTACTLQRKILEVKPHYQSKWKINQNKWTAAEQYAKENNYSFQVLTEKEIQP